MSTSVELPGKQGAWTPPESTPLNEGVWQAWLAKGRVQDRRGHAAKLTVMKWASIVGVAVAAAFWLHRTPF
jgi:hypothetical protein